jgi:hypothetical protein
LWGVVAALVAIVDGWGTPKAEEAARELRRRAADLLSTASAAVSPPAAEHQESTVAAVAGGGVAKLPIPSTDRPHVEIIGSRLTDALEALRSARQEIDDLSLAAEDAAREPDERELGNHAETARRLTVEAHRWIRTAEREIEHAIGGRLVVLVVDDRDAAARVVHGSDAYRGDRASDALVAVKWSDGPAVMAQKINAAIGGAR